ncbi:MAG TPA: YARHG domain-containing protein, partial [Flavisolibacter sp.]|nr:YARHG domain-containing protein [Flavisolibacter sp.]
SGDVDGMPKNGLHPYMRDFTVQLNGAMLKYNVAYVTDSTYAKNGIIKSKKLPEVISSIQDENYVDFFYVYYFKAKFKKGLNIIKHTYNYDLSGSVSDRYSFEYVLTAANRWSNKQIDDFTLILDMGEFESFKINKDFFKDGNDWLINGIGKSKEVKGVKDSDEEKDAVRFHIQKGNLVFHKMNFHPKGELFVYEPSGYQNSPRTGRLPFSYYLQNTIEGPKTELEKKILKNLPFARRGYIFQNADLKSFFEKQEWYIPNPNYEPDVDRLTETEKQWINKWQ